MSDPIATNQATLDARRDYTPEPPVVPDDFQGVALPVRVGLRGRCVLQSGASQLDKLLTTAMRDCDSENPFQQLGIDQSVIFKGLTARRIARARVAALQILQRDFAGRLYAKDEDIITIHNHETGDLTLDMTYTEVRTGRKTSTTIPVSEAV